MIVVQPVRESATEKKIREYAIAVGWWVAKFVSPGKRGVPDRVFIRQGVTLWMEVKREGKEPTTQQQTRHEEMRRHGAIVVWCDTFEQAKEWLDLL